MNRLRQLIVRARLRWGHQPDVEEQRVVEVAIPTDGALLIARLAEIRAHEESLKVKAKGAGDGQ